VSAGNGNNSRVYLATTQSGVARDTKHIQHELWHGLTTDPEEHALAILHEKEPISLEPLRRERERWWHDYHTVLDRSARLERAVNIPYT
jgi:hypothetical protein